MADGKQAFIVMGPESSGTRLLAKLFIAAGCEGDSGHRQRLDAALSNGHAIEAQRVVVRRSYPYAKEWPNLVKLSGRLRHQGFDVKAVVIVRNLHFTAKSSQRQKHTHSDSKAMRRSTEALRRIGAALHETGLPYAYITYEALVHYPENVLDWLFDWAGLPAPEGVRIYDGNEKYV